MALPVELAQIPIKRRTYVYRDTGAPAAGKRITAELDTEISVGDTTIVPKRITITLDDNGQVPAGLTLPSTNDPDLNITGLAYTIEEKWPGGRKGLLTVAYDAAEVDLADLVDTVAPPSDTAAQSAAQAAAASATTASSSAGTATTKAGEASASATAAASSASTASTAATTATTKATEASASAQAASDSAAAAAGSAAAVYGDLASTASGKGAELVSFLQSGTGAVARTVSAKNADALHIFDFMTGAQIADARSGAKTLDLAAPTQAALNEAGASGRVLEFKGANCRVDSTLTIPANVHLDGRKAKLDFSNLANGAGLSNNAGGAIIEGFEEIRGPGNSVYAANSVAISASGTYNAGLAPTYIEGPKVRNCKIIGWGAYGVRPSLCNNPDVYKNRIEDIGYAAVGGISCNNGHADRNYIRNVSPGTLGNGYAVFWSRNEGTELENPRSYDCTADDNYIKDCTLWEGIDTHGGVNITAHRNTFDNVKKPIAFVPSNVSGVPTLAPQRCKASFNTIKNAVNGVVVDVSGATSGGVVNEYAAGCEVAENDIFGGGLAGSNTNGVVRITGTKDFQGRGNKLANGSVYGYCLMSDNLNFNITGGTIKDMSDATVTDCCGVAVRSNNNTGYIGGITFVRENTGLTNVMVNSALVSPATTGNDISVGPCNFIGDTSAALTLSLPVAIPTVRSVGAMELRGSGTVAQTSGSGSNLLDVTFAKAFPAIPGISVALTAAPTTGGKTPYLYVTNITRTGFRAVAYPADGTTWSASGSLTFNWRATA